jgi:UDP-N-acetylmuramyl pentapeptide phosphotransferase/UDP-N-acetylglucosamine-1-phosphate transferase
MPISIDTVFPAALVFAVVVLGMAPLIRVLEHFHFLDHPNERSSHERPTLIGGGILIVVSVIPAWLYAGGEESWYLMALGLGLAAVSLYDDVRGAPTAVRLFCHFGAVLVMLRVQPGLAGWLPEIIPESLAVAGVALGWVWFINLFNFMDGVDGITGTETLSICLGIVALAAAGKAPGSLSAPALAMGAAAAGFLLWNWHPAKIFMGDVGSVLLGYLLGWMLLALAASGNWVPAVILPAYYLSDSTLTLLRRLVRRKKIWHAHREHYYQRPAIAGVPHSKIVLPVVGCNALLILISFFHHTLGISGALALAALAVSALLLYFSHLGRPPAAPPSA